MRKPPGIRLLVMIPLIFTGLCFVALSGAWFLLGPAPSRPPAPPFLLWGAVMLLLTALVAALITWQVFRPMRRFARVTAQLPVLDSLPPAVPVSPPRDELEEYNRLFEQVSGLLSKLEARQFFPGLVGQSRIMRGVMAQMLKVAPSDTTVLLCGETGTGKELAARAIVAQSPRKERPLVTINCAAIPEGLLESELFGHEKGAFTGAVGRRIGKFAEAGGGTVFLDEIGEVPPAIQVKLLRVLQEKVIEPLGGNRPQPVDVRIIAASNRDLAALVAEGTFRQDLFYRLNVFSITLPPLRLRREDIPLLAEALPTAATVSSAAMARLLAYDWPGNVRELRNVLERAALLADHTEIGPEHLPAHIREAAPAAPPAAAGPTAAAEGVDLDCRLRETERYWIVSALSQSEGVQVKAAELLGIKERSLHHRIKKHQIDVRAFKGANDH